MSGLRALTTALLLSVAAPAFAIYKCDTNGKVMYSEAPCPGGKVLDIDTAPPADASKADKQAARERRATLRMEKRETLRMENERRKREAREEREQRRAAKAHAAKQKKCATLVRRQRWAEEDAASATGRSADKARRKARRAAEVVEDECGKQNTQGLSIAG